MKADMRKSALRKANWPPRDVAPASPQRQGADGAMRMTARPSFWGAPRIEPTSKDIARLVTVIREACDGRPDGSALALATAALHATAAFLAHRFQPREALAVIDKVRAEILGEG
jgi:hypothetical protein